MDHEVYKSILKASTNIDLPAAPAFQEVEETHAEQVLQVVEGVIGEAAKSPYYSSSRLRFAMIIQLAARHVPTLASKRARILDVGNAPGYLGLALHKAGYEVSGINVTADWMGAYPSPEVASLFDVKVCDVEKGTLPFADSTFDAIVFTEVLEHIAIKNPAEILPEFQRVLRPAGKVLFSTPNVCNLSNVIALMKGSNIFWPSEIFFGSTDRHNREFTPAEVKNLFLKGGFEIDEFFGINDHANWRTNTEHDIYAFLSANPESHPMLRNTTVGVFRCD